MAKQKQAEFMLKMAEIIYGIVLTGLLGTSVLVWFSSDAQTNGSFGYFMTLAIVGLFGGIYLQRQAMAIFNLPADKVQDNISMPVAASSDITGPLSIQIKHGNTHVSIHIQPEKNDTP